MQHVRSVPRRLAYMHTTRLAAALALLSLLSWGSAGACTVGADEAGKRATLEFLAAVIDRKDAEAALRFLGDQYIQHNPSVATADGKAGLVKFIAFLRARHPQARIECKRIVADGDLVAVHGHLVLDPGTRGQAIADFFRLTPDHRIVEHWDVIQDVPEKSPNPNGMF